MTISRSKIVDSQWARSHVASLIFSIEKTACNDYSKLLCGDKTGMIDVHCHLVDNKFNYDVDDVVRTANLSGVQRMINVPEYESQFEKSVNLAKKWAGVVHTGIGIHPIQKRGKSARMKNISKLEQFFVEHEHNIICVGECGLDHTTTQFRITEADFEEQETVFKRQIDLAKHFEKPLNVHSRSAARRTIEVLQECLVAPDQVVLHAFDGNLEDVKIGVAAGYLFSVPPSFSRLEKTSQLIESIPLPQLLLETDSPALGRDKCVRNVPSNLCQSAEYVANVKNMKICDVISATSENAQRVFNFR